MGGERECLTLSWTREDSVRRREGNEEVLYVTSAILIENDYERPEGWIVWRTI